MTTHMKGYPFEVLIEGEQTSVVPAVQIKSLEWGRQNVKFKGNVPNPVLADVTRKIAAPIGGA
jgi:mRNA interferase MazF